MTDTIYIDGLIGKIAILRDLPALNDSTQRCGVALITHPHPLMGGNATHKVPEQIARTFCSLGYVSYRPSFRGVDGTEGEYDDGYGECDDIIQVLHYLRQQHPNVPIALAGFSFGAYVITRLLNHITADTQADIKYIILTGLPVGIIHGMTYQPMQFKQPALVIHGELDEIAPLSATFSWAAVQKRPVTVLPQANHFFTGYLNQLKELVIHYINQR